MATVKAKIEFNGEEYDLSVEDIEGILFNVKEIIRMLNLNDITRCYSNDRYEIYIVANSHYYIQIDKSTFKVLVITYKKFCKIFKQFNDWNIERYNNLFGSSIDAL